MSYEIEGQIPRGVPTFGGVIADLKALGCDRGSLVREATPSTEAGLLIIMLSKEAVRAIGPVCIEAAGKLVDGREPKAPEMKVEADTRISEVFRLMEQRKARWWWTGTTDRPPLCCYFLSQEICEWLAPRLTAAGCPTKLT